jgi:hypothetical protein
MIIEPPIAFPPRLGSLTPKLFAKVFTNQRMCIQMLGIVRIFGREEFGSSKSGKNRSPLSWAQIS